MEGSNNHYFKGLVGRSPNGYPKLCLYLRAPEASHLIKYDPASLETDSGAPRNVSRVLTRLKQRTQRIIEEKRVKEITGYLRRAVEGKRFGDIGAVELTTYSKPDLARYAVEGVVGLPFDSEFFIQDGQHRVCAVQDLCRLHPEQAKDLDVLITILCLPEDKFEEYSGQGFSDKGRFQKPLTYVQAMAGDSSDRYIRLAREVGKYLESKGAGPAIEVTSAKPEDAAFAPISTLHKFVKGFIEGRDGLNPAPISEPKLNDSTVEAIKINLMEYVDLLLGEFASWTKKPDERREFLSRSSAVLQALGVVGHEIYKTFDDADGRAEAVLNIGESALDWRRTNEAWNGIVGSIKNGKFQAGSARQQIDNTINYLKKLALPSEMMAADQPHAASERE